MSLFSELFESKSKMVRVRVMAVNKLIAIPIIRVSANPLTGPEPVTK